MGSPTNVILSLHDAHIKKNTHASGSSPYTIKLDIGVVRSLLSGPMASHVESPSVSPTVSSFLSLRHVRPLRSTRRDRSSNHTGKPLMKTKPEHVVSCPQECMRVASCLGTIDHSGMAKLMSTKIPSSVSRPKRRTTSGEDRYRRICKDVVSRSPVSLVPVAG